MPQNQTRTDGLLGRLFTHYMAGQIEERLWDRFVSALDSFETNPMERNALISFVYDALTGNDARTLNRLLAETVRA